jgi:RNase P subunit RPR2
MDFEGYCVKCRSKVQVKNGTVKVSDNKRKMVQGKCPKCDTTVTRFLPSK